MYISVKITIISNLIPKMISKIQKIKYNWWKIHKSPHCLELHLVIKLKLWALMMNTFILPSYIYSLYGPGYSWLLILLMCVQIVILIIFIRISLRRSRFSRWAQMTFTIFLAICRRKKMFDFLSLISRASEPSQSSVRLETLFQGRYFQMTWPSTNSFASMKFDDVRW